MGNTILNLLRYLRGFTLGMLLEHLFRVECNSIGVFLCALLFLNILIDLDNKNKIVNFFLDVFIYLTLAYIWIRKRIGRPIKYDKSSFRQPK